MNSETQSAVEIPKTYLDAESFANTMTEQLTMAGQVQRDFLPRFLPDSEGFQWAVTFLPAEVVSGDMYDVARVDEKHIGFYVADVVGHGMPAALLTMYLKQAIMMRETIGNSYRVFEPEEVLTKLNLRMTEQKLSGNQFVTCCYCLLDMETLELTFSRGGHPYPVLIRSGCQPEQLQEQGSLVGVFGNVKFVQQTVKLNKGDKLLLYSDGAERFIGRFNDEGNFIFSDEFIGIKDLNINEINDRLSSCAQNRYVSPDDLDDITIVGLEII
jgi:sigma-B regulation protein RsbU (phosphoserine phosphatase)